MYVYARVRVLWYMRGREEPFSHLALLWPTVSGEEVSGVVRVDDLVVITVHEESGHVARLHELRRVHVVDAELCAVPSSVGDVRRSWVT